MSADSPIDLERRRRLGPECCRRLGPESCRRLGAALMGAGLALLVWAVLYMNVSALGVAPAERSFAYRRPYNEVKRSAHEAFPGFLLRAASGGLLIWFGLRLRRRQPAG